MHISNMIGEPRSEYKLKSPPSDAISSVKFGPLSSQFLLVSSWDNSVRLYDIQSNNLRMMYSHDRPVLDCCFQVNIMHIYVVDKFRPYITFYLFFIFRMLFIHLVVVWIIPSKCMT